MKPFKPISDEELVRYQRQISVQEIGLTGQKQLSEASVLVIGCGGLGSSASLYLAGAGVGQLILADGDLLEKCNLHRQIAYRESDLDNPKSLALANQLSALNKTLRVRTVDDYLDGTRLKLEVMMADLVLDCSDNYESRQSINRACYESSTPLISAAAIGWKGQLISFNYLDSEEPCYRCYCSLTKNVTNTNCSSDGVIGPVVGLLGNLQALEAIKVITKQASGSETSLYLFNGLNMKWTSNRIVKDPVCPICSSGKEVQISEFIKGSTHSLGGDKNECIFE